MRCSSSRAFARRTPPVDRRSQTRASRSYRRWTQPDYAAGAGRAWLRWSGFVERRPWRIALASAALMLVIAGPASALRLGSSDASNDPSGHTTHRAYELLAEGFGRGFNGPLQIVAQSHL